MVHDLTPLRKAMGSKNSVEGSKFGREVGEREVVPWTSVESDDWPTSGAGGIFLG